MDTNKPFHRNSGDLLLISGPCVIENEKNAYDTARFLKDVCRELEIDFVFKASYDKANRTSIRSFRGPGMYEGLKILQGIRSDLQIRVLSDVHRFEEIEPAAEVLDIIQIPAFLCRQTDLILEAAGTNKPLNIKKGQFMAPWDMKNVVEKAESAGNRNILITERGTMFGYNNLVVDYRGIAIMQNFGCPVIFDATHSVQLPGGAGQSSAGQREFAPLLSKAAVAAGVDGIFLEVHENPEKALCDGPNSVKLGDLKPLLLRLKSIKKALDE
jgi:2-dehydro-3-deoxyphosphooctonate aldolase (KDO 8-P synthase)